MQKPRTNQTYLLLSLLLGLALGGCSIRNDEFADEGFGDFSNIPNAIPRHEPRSKYGNPDSYVVFGKRYYVMDSSSGFIERGIASWYGPNFHGKRTSSGETYDMYKMTAAHKNLPLPSYVKVTNLQNGRSVVVRVNDRGPFHEGRVIDLSYTAAQKLDVVRTGTARVEVRALNTRRGKPAILARREPPRLKSVLASVPAQGASLPTGDIYIQAGAFSSENNALTLRKRIAAMLASDVRITPSVDGLLYRVQVGPLQSIDHIDPISRQLQNLGLTALHVVID